MPWMCSILDVRRELNMMIEGAGEKEFTLEETYNAKDLAGMESKRWEELTDSDMKLICRSAWAMRGYGEYPF